MRPNEDHRVGTQTILRQNNLSAILQCLRENAPISRSDLADLTGLTKTTVSSLISELIVRGFVKEIGFGKSTGVGRRKILLELNPTIGFIVSCEIAYDYAIVICTDFTPKVIWRKRESIDPNNNPRDYLYQVVDLINEAIEIGNNECCENLLGTAIGVPGLVEQQSGMIMYAPNMGWKDVPLQEILIESITAPIYIDNEANMAAFGEHYLGVAQGYNEILYISAGVGIEGGILHNGKLILGATGSTAQFGHMILLSETNVEVCSCGKCGCWETQASHTALFNFIKRSINSGEDSLLLEMLDGDISKLTVTKVSEAANKGDKVSIDALKRVGRNLGIGIVSLINAFNPELVVLGGPLSIAGEFLLPIVREEVARYSLPWSVKDIEITLAQYGFDAVAMGGVAEVYQAVLAEPELINLSEGSVL